MQSGNHSTAAKPTVFISYSHKDEKEKNKLLDHLGILKHTGLIDLWSDDHIGAGADWEDEISRAMELANVAILLISVNFLISDFILRKEIPKLLERRQSEGLIIFPVIAKACAWDEVVWLAKLNVRPKNGRPVWSGSNSEIDKDLTAIAKEVADIVQSKKNDLNKAKQRVNIYLEGEFSSLSAERRSSTIDALAALLKIPTGAIDVYRVSEGSVVFELGMPSSAVQRLRMLLETNNSELRLLKIEKVMLITKSGEIEERMVKTGPVIENSRQYALPSEAETILKIMFDKYQRVVIKAELSGGLSGSRIFVVRPVISDTSALLRTVVKLAPASLIEKEWWAYKTHIRFRLPDAAQIEDEPVLLPYSQWGGLRYALMGAGGTFNVASLYQYLRQASIENINFVLKERLFKKLDQSFRQASPKVEFQLQASYDRILPVNLLIKPVPKLEAMPWLIKPDALPSSPLKPGDYVRVEGFVITKVDPGHKSVTLNLPKNHPHGSYALRLKPIETIKADRLGDIIDPIEGIISETRQGRLEAEAERIFGQAFNLAGETVSWTNGPDLPNPLVKWSTFLKEARDVKVVSIHGDLNLENILVDPDIRDVSLIDFADARQDHVLHDFFRLETETVTKIIPEILYKHGLPPETIVAFYRHLHQAVSDPSQTIAPPNHLLGKPWVILLAIRQMAGKYLGEHGDWTEYYQGLGLYLLGALKFKNLDEMNEAPAPLPKQVAFWGAAIIMGMIENSPTHSPATQQFIHAKSQSIPSEQVIPPATGAHPVEVTYLDFFSPFEVGLQRLETQMGQVHPRYSDFLVYEQQLTENIKRSRRFGNTRDRQAERAEIVEQLNELALSVMGVSFNNLCE